MIKATRVNDIVLTASQYRSPQVSLVSLCNGYVGVVLKRLRGHRQRFRAIYQTLVIR